MTFLEKTCLKLAHRNIPNGMNLTDKITRGKGVMFRMAIVGKKPHEIVKKLVDDFYFTTAMVAKYSNVSHTTVVNMMNDTKYSDGLINKKFLQVMEFFGYDVEIVLHGIDGYSYPVGKLNTADQIAVDIRKHKARGELEQRTVRRLREVARRTKEDPMYYIEHDDDVLDAERTKHDASTSAIKKKPKKNSDRLEEIPDEDVFDPEYKKAEERRAKNREAVRASRERKKLGLPPAKRGRKPKKDGGD